MTSTEIREIVVRAITTIAPEVSPTALADQAPLRDTLDLDSMDFLNLLVQLSQTLHLEIPERDYAKLQTLGNIVTYLATKLEPVQ